MSKIIARHIDRSGEKTAVKNSTYNVRIRKNEVDFVDQMRQGLIQINSKIFFGCSKI